MSKQDIIDKLYCLILAGGRGRRLWPESLPDMPKQFIDFFGTGRTQIQETYNRFREFLPADHIFISTNETYRDLVKEQLPEVEDSNILAEPIWRNTGPSTAWGCFRVLRRDKDSVIIVSPADQHIVDAKKFQANILTGAEFVASRNTILTMGVKPTRAEPGYGYIQFDKQVGDGIFEVKTFMEKPDREFAQMFVDSGEFFWNTGLFLANTSNLLEFMRKQMPPILKHFDTRVENHTIEQENAYVASYFPLYPNVSMEKGVIEKTQEVAVMKCDFGWADLGTWHGIYEAVPKNDGDNVVIDSDVILENAHKNIIKIPKGHLAVINGLDGYIVVEKGDTLLICPREDSSALIRKYSAEVEIR